MRVNRQLRPCGFLGIFPSAQKNVGLREASLDVQNREDLFDRSFQLVQSLIPFALASMHVRNEMQGQRVVRPQFDRALKFS